MRGAGFAQIYALLTVRARRPGPEQSKPPRRRRRAVRFNLENQANAFPMSSPPSVPNSYWGSDTFRKDSVGWSSSLNAPDRPRYDAAGPGDAAADGLAVVIPDLRVAREIAVEVAHVLGIPFAVEEDAPENAEELDVRQSIRPIEILDVEAGEDDVARELGQLRAGGGRRRREHD